MNKIIKTDDKRKEIAAKEAIRAEKSRKSSAVERGMRNHIYIWSVIMMVIMPILTEIGLRAVNVWLDTYISVYYPSTAITVLQWVTYYLKIILTLVYQFGGFAVLGYSVMRYSVKKSLCPLLLSIVSITIGYGSGIFETIYLYGVNAIKSNFAYYVTYWTLNYFLSLFTTLCIIFLCAMLRFAFMHHSRLQMQVQIVEEPREERRKNALRRLYLWIALLLFVFNFVPDIQNMIGEYRKVGAPEDIWDLITFVQPLITTPLMSAFGYFIMLRVGTVLTNQYTAQQEYAEK